MNEWSAEHTGFGAALGRPSAQRPPRKRAAAKPTGRKGGVRAWLQSARAVLVERITGGVVPASAVREALAGGTLFGQWGLGGDDDFRGYRSEVSSGAQPLRRELDWQTYAEVVGRSLYAYAANPLGGWLVDKTVDMCVGDQLTFTVNVKPDKLPDTQRSDAQVNALEQDVRTHLDRFWEHRAHNFRMRAREYATTHLVTGNLLMPVTFLDANPETGVSMLGVPTLDLIDAQQITRVRSAERSAIVAGEVFYESMQYGGGPAQGGEAKSLKVIREDERGELVGDAFFFPHKSLLNSLAGYPWLMRVLDWLDRQDDFMFKTLDRAGLLNSIVWHMSMDGLTPDQCRAESDRLTREGLGTNPNMVVVTNEKGSLEAAHPKFEAGDIDTFARTLRTHILGAFSFPESWYSSGGETNRATSADQTDVTYKSLETMQGRLLQIYLMPLQFAYDMGRKAQGDGLRRGWPARSTGAIEIRVNLPPIRERDYQRSGAALGAVLNAIEQAEQAEFVSHETGQKIVWMAAAKLGHDIEDDEERAAIEREREEKEEADAERANGRAALALANAAKAADPMAPAEPGEAEEAGETD